MQPPNPIYSRSAICDATIRRASGRRKGAPIRRRNGVGGGGAGHKNIIAEDCRDPRHASRRSGEGEGSGSGGRWVEVTGGRRRGSRKLCRQQQVRGARVGSRDRRYRRFASATKACAPFPVPGLQRSIRGYTANEIRMTFTDRRRRRPLPRHPAGGRGERKRRGKLWSETKARDCSARKRALMAVLLLQPMRLFSAH